MEAVTQAQQIMSLSANLGIDTATTFYKAEEHAIHKRNGSDGVTLVFKDSSTLRFTRDNTLVTG